MILIFYRDTAGENMKHYTIFIVAIYFMCLGNKY